MRRAIGVAVIENKKLLLVRKKDVWILPGGKPKGNEEDLECLHREISEELKSKVDISNFYSYFNGKTPHKGDYLEAKVYFGVLTEEIYPSREIIDARFISNFEDYNISNITKSIIESLKKDGYI